MCVVIRITINYVIKGVVRRLNSSILCLFTLPLQMDVCFFLNNSTTVANDETVSRVRLYLTLQTVNLSFNGTHL